MKKIHYGWIICIACFLMHFLGCGVVNSTFSVFLPVFKTLFDLPNSTSANIVTVRVVVSLLCMIIAGKVYDTFSIRTGVLLGYAAFIAGLIMMSLASDCVHLFIAACFLGVCFSFSATLPITLIVNNWFSTRKSFAMSISIMGSGVATSTMSPVLTACINRYGYTKALYIELVFVAAAAALIFLLIRDEPEDKGLCAYGADKAESTVQKPVKYVLNEKPISIISLNAVFVCSFFVGLATMPFANLMILHFTIKGYTAMLAASAMTANGMAMVLGKVVYGTVTDRFGIHISTLVVLGALSAGLFLTGAANGLSLTSMYAGAALGGFGQATGSVGIALWITSLVPKSGYAAAAQKNQVAFTAGTVLGNAVPGFIADITGDFTVGFMCLTAVAILALIVIERIFLKRIRECYSPDMNS